MSEKFLGIGRDKDRVAHTVTSNGTLHKFLMSCLEAYKDRTEKWSEADNSAVLTAINNLTNFVKENLMTLKDDFATLQGKFDTMESAVTAVAEDIAALKNEIKEANDRANIDLSPLVARAEGIEAGLRAAAGSQAGSDPDAPPPGGGETGGETETGGGTA